MSAYVIAETLRHRGDLQEVEVPTALVTELRLLVNRPHRPGGRPGPDGQPAPRRALRLLPCPGAGLRLRPQSRRADAAEWLPDPGRDPPDRSVPAADWLVKRKVRS